MCQPPTAPSHMPFGSHRLILGVGGWAGLLSALQSQAAQAYMILGPREEGRRACRRRQGLGSLLWDV